MASLDFDDGALDWSEPGYNAPSASEDEHLVELAKQSHRLAGFAQNNPKRIELLEDDVRYLIQENSDLEAALAKWEEWYEAAPEVGDAAAHWDAWYRGAPFRH